MLPADGGRVEHDVAIGMPAQNQAIAIERQQLSGALPL